MPKESFSEKSNIPIFQDQWAMLDYQGNKKQKISETPEKTSKKVPVMWSG